MRRRCSGIEWSEDSISLTVGHGPFCHPPDSCAVYFVTERRQRNPSVTAVLMIEERSRYAFAAVEG